MADQLTAQPDTDQRDLDELQESSDDPESGMIYVSKEEAEDLFDRQAQTYLGMSGAEFRRQYRAGAIQDSDRTDVIRVSYLLFLADE